MRASTSVRVVRYGLVSAVGAAVLAASGLLADFPAPPEPPPTTAMITLDGMTVPDVGPLPSVVPMPAANLTYHGKVELGRQLYFDGRLSKSGQVPCAFCHLPAAGFADPRQTSIGFSGRLGGRNAPTVYNAGFNRVQFWDGRAGSLEEQAIGPIHNPVEMAETHETVVPKIAKIPGYQKQFRLVFGKDVSLQSIAEAIAAFERTIVSTNSAFDQHAMGDPKAMDEAAVRGLALFRGKARCILCHNGPNFTDNSFHNLGVPQVGPLKVDLGRYAVTRLESDKGAFKTPTLRSITETAPYMHDGVFRTLEEVIDFLDKGGEPNPNLSPLIKTLGLTAEEKQDLLAFLKALTGEPLKVTVPKLP